MNNPHFYRARSLWRTARAAAATISVICSLLGGTVATYAADGVLAGASPTPGVTQLTLPNPIWLPGAQGGHLWVADNGLTFCRLDGPPRADGTLSVNISTCDITAKSPAQAALDPSTNADGTRYLYIADDPQAGSRFGAGHVWTVNAAQVP